MSLPIIFDGLDLNDGETYVISNFAQSVGTRETDLITIPGRDGAVVGQNTMQPTVFTFDIAILGATVEERDQNLRNLFGTTIGGALHGVLSSESERELVIHESSSSARHYTAIPSGGEVVRFADGLSISGVTFTCPDPTYTDGVTLTESGASISIDYMGNSHEYPVINLSNVVPTGGVAGFVWSNDEEAGTFVFNVDQSETYNINIDCATRTAIVTTVDEVISEEMIPALSSNWPYLANGNNILSAAGSFGTIGSFSVEYQTRWVG